jgi:hypothetical protein
MRNCGFKSPFLKGGFRGIIKRLFNPPCPPFRKGGVLFSRFKRVADSRLEPEIGFEMISDRTVAAGFTVKNFYEAANAEAHLSWRRRFDFDDC